MGLVPDEGDGVRIDHDAGPRSGVSPIPLP